MTDALTADHEAGLAYYPTAVTGTGITATFDSLIDSGTGADGLTFMLADAAAGNPTLGADGGGLGFSGNHGLAIALDTFKSAVKPSANFVGIATGSGPTVDTLTWGSTTGTVPALRGTAVRVVVSTTTTGLTVTVNATRVVS